MSEYPLYSKRYVHWSKLGGSYYSTQIFGCGQCSHQGGISESEKDGRLHRECTSCGYQWDEAVVVDGNSG